MGTERRRQILLAAVAIALAVVAYQAWPRTSASTSPASNQRRTQPGAAATGTTGANGRAEKQAAKQPQGGSGAPDVHLEALDAERPKPGAVDRNLFRFKPKAPPPPPPVGTKPVDTSANQPPAGPPPPPPPPPITVKFIGLADVAPDRPKIAVLSDGLGAPQIGSEGQTVFGKYRILKIGVESIELAYLDGRGRQTIRLSGS
jgi:hypothetical protein